MPDRFVFRQVYLDDIPLFLADGEIRAKNHESPQRCHQTSYQEIVDRRGSDEFKMPCGGVVNDYVPFYFSPITAFTYTIHCGNVQLRTHDGTVLRTAEQESRAFFVAKATRIFDSGLDIYFSNVALNSMALDIELDSDPKRLESVVNWSVFDESPRTAFVPEVGYEGVCSWFHSRDTPVRHQNRSKERMAEFLVRRAVPLDVFECVVVHNTTAAGQVEAMIARSGAHLPVIVKRGCYF